MGPAKFSKSGWICVSLFLAIMMVAGNGLAADRLVVKDDGGTNTFVVEDSGRTTASNLYRTQRNAPGFWLDETGTGMKGAFFVLDNSTFQIQRRPQGFGATNEGAPLRFKLTAPPDSFVFDENGNVGFGKSIASLTAPIDTGTGAYLSAGGVWTDASSRDFKDEIKELSVKDALETFKQLKPVTFSYKLAPGENHVGFIAEDVPDLVATKDRKGLSSMDIVATLTKVLQEQQKTIKELSKKVGVLEEQLNNK